MPLSIGKRWEIIFLTQHSLGPRLSNSKAAKHINTDPKTISHWVETWKNTGDVQDEPHVGRKRKTSEKEDSLIITTAEKFEEEGSESVSKILKTGQKMDVSGRTVRRRLKEAGYFYSSPKEKPLLLERHRKERLEWAKRNKETDWSKVIFTDESTVRLKPVRIRVWRKKGQYKVVRTMKESAKVNVWGCFSEKGFGRLFWFSQNLKKELMCEIYKDWLLPSASDMFGEGDDSWVLQEDNDPKHNAIMSQRWKEDHNVKRLDWPSQSPDLNPIENVWSVMKVNIAKRHPKNVRQLRKIVDEEWDKCGRELAQKLVKSMPHRIQAVIAAEGDYIMY